MTTRTSSSPHQESEWRTGNCPSEYPTGTICAFVLALAVFMAIPAYRYFHEWTALERAYVLHYVFSGSKWLSGEKRSYRMLITVSQSGNEYLTEGWEVLPIPHTGRSPAREAVPFELSPEAKQRGSVRLEWQRFPMDNEELNQFLQERVYHGETLGGMILGATWWGLAVLVAGLCVGIPHDRRAAQVRREGRVLRGPLVVTRDEFNRKRKKGGRTDGIGFVTTERQMLREWLWVRYHYGPTVRIPREDEPRHALFMGTTASGKTTAMQQVLIQARDRGETAIIHDPAWEYVRRFYDPGRGDIILNPLDERSPYWSLGEEVEHEAEALTIAHGLFPDQPRETPFFLNSVRKLFAHLLRLHPTPEQLVEWMSDPREIDRRIEGTPYASIINRSAPNQREGVLGTMNQVADTIRLLKTEGQCWTARDWAKKRQGWIFLTSTPETREALRPLDSLWLDLLILRLLHQANDPTVRRVWMVLDEISTLHRLPQLETALTQNRKANTSILLGLQGKAQLETIYGHIAETLLAMPWTALFFKTTEPDAAEWISRYLGIQEIERWRESRTSEMGWGNKRETKTGGVERLPRYPVLASQISGLEERKGYLKSGNFIVPLTVKYSRLPDIAEGFIPRKLPPMFPVQTEQKKEEPERERSQQREQKPGLGRRFFE